MNSIDNSIAIRGMAARAGARSQSESHSGKPPVKDTTIKSGPGNTRLNPVQTEVSFSTYGSRNERIAVVVKNKDTERSSVKSLPRNYRNCMSILTCYSRHVSTSQSTHPVLARYNRQQRSNIKNRILSS